MSHDNDARKANAEARFRKAEVKAAEGAEAKAAHDAEIVSRDANTERLKALRLARDETDRAAAAAAKSAKPVPASRRK